MIEMENDLILHVIHVSGKRMIRQGSDGLSRADHSQGVMTGASMESFIPLHQSALEQDTRLEKWLSDVTRGLGFQVLDPSGWFSTAHSQGNFIWIPPPAAADVVMEQLLHARHKRPESLHIVVVPRLITGRWQRLMIRRTDGYARLLASDVWPMSDQCEPLLIFVALSFRSWDPQHRHRAGLLERFQRIMLGIWAQETVSSAGITRRSEASLPPVRAVGALRASYQHWVSSPSWYESKLMTKEMR
jgi:hypothetical protein